MIDDYYQRLQITPDRRETLAGMLPHKFDRHMSVKADELGQLTVNRDRLENERDQLVQAHYADAIPLAVLKMRARPDHQRASLVNRPFDAHPANTPTPAPT